jgi:hypothetical protein
MNRKQLTILVVLVLLIGGLGLFFYNRENASWQASDRAGAQKLLPDFPINDVAQIVIKQAGKELNLIKQDDLWRVKERWNYPANFSEIGGLLRKMWELKTVQSVKVGPSQFDRLELLPPDKGTNTGTLVEFKDKGGKAIKSLLLGKKVSRESPSSSPFGGGDFPVGRYVLVQETPPKVSLISDPLSDVETKADRWLNKDFFKVEKLRSISMTSTNATNSWKVLREDANGELKLADTKDGEQPDPTKLSGVGNALASPSFSDVVSPDAKADETGLDSPLVATIETFDNFVYTVQVGKKTDDDNYRLKVSVSATIAKDRTPGKDERPEDKEKLDKEFQEKVKKLEEKLKQEKSFESWTYLVAKWSIDPILKERKDLLVEKKEAPKTEEPKKDEPKADEPKKEAGIPPLPGITPDTKPEVK